MALQVLAGKSLNRVDIQSVTSTLVGLTIPIAAVAIALGAIALIRAAILMNHGERLRRSPAAERVAMFLCAACATTATLMTAEALRDGNRVVSLFAIAQLASAAAGLGFYSTSRRPLSEGFAAIAMGFFAILGAFSIGVFISPFALAMGVLASHHLRVERRSESAR